jgi:aspartyl-tRNA(Asn)/glutamyl-tRNA(Gln) amidotransferase subunit C
MSFTTADVEKLAELAKLNVTKDQLDSLTNDLSRILELVEKMDQEDTKDIPPLAHPLESSQPLRTDAISEANQRELFQKNAPQVQAGLYIVPQFVETE